MFKNIESIVKETEEKWLDRLYYHVKSTFAGKALPSHNEDHHLRVWKYSVGLIMKLQLHGLQITPSDLENLILAVFFHDTGLIKDPGRNHGKVSSRLFEDWMEENGIVGVGSAEIASAIEHHDNKIYHFHVPLSSENKMHLPGILAISDDLDAFGYCGIYRYSEIYLLRNIPLNELAFKVLENAERRYDNFARICKGFPDLISMHTERYMLMVKFFKVHKAQLANDPDCINTTSGPVFITTFIHKQLKSGNSLEELCESGIRESINDADKDFFRSLNKEWSGGLDR